MADGGEIIGGVVVTVGADFSDLDAQFEAAVARAVADGSTLAEAISAAMKVPDASAVVDAFSQAGAAAQAAATQIGLFDDAAHVSWADAAGQLNLFTTELEPIAAAAQKAADGLGGFGSPRRHLGLIVAGI